jgi:DNA (cytosine-5)-methyltransferase 1
VEVIDRFAGPGGWDQGILPLGIRPLGIELNPVAAATAEAAGHRRLVTDVTALSPADFGPVWGGLDSPPCPGWSIAGTGGARRDAVHVLAELENVHTLRELEELLARLRDTMEHPETLLALEPLRWAMAGRPQWVAWEQVKEVQPLWHACARILRELGYTVATGVVNAEQYGVPQTRRRAILLARGPELSAALGPARLPAPTHSRYHSHAPARLDHGVKPWVTIADALGWERGEPVAIRSNYGTGGDPAARGVRTADQPAAFVTSKVNRNRWTALVKAQGAGMVARHGGRPPRQPDQPAFTILSAKGGGSIRYRWEDGQSLTVTEAAALQTFPEDYPWQGGKTAQLQQVGDAVPPLLARVLVSEVTGIPDPLR